MALRGGLSERGGPGVPARFAAPSRVAPRASNAIKPFPRLPSVPRIGGQFLTFARGFSRTPIPVFAPIPALFPVEQLLTTAILRLLPWSVLNPVREAGSPGVIPPDDLPDGVDLSGEISLEPGGQTRWEATSGLAAVLEYDGVGDPFLDPAVGGSPIPFGYPADGPNPFGLVTQWPDQVVPIVRQDQLSNDTSIWRAGYSSEEAPQPIWWATQQPTPNIPGTSWIPGLLSLDSEPLALRGVPITPGRVGPVVGSGGALRPSSLPVPVPQPLVSPSDPVVPKVAPPLTIPRAVPGAEPAPSPDVPPVPGPTRPPQIAPLSTVPPTPRPSPPPLRTGSPVLPGADPDVGLTPDGGTEPITQPEPVQQTPPDSVVIGQTPIAGPGAGPQPKVEAIAKELGKVEAKLHRVVGGGQPDPPGDGPPPPNLLDLLDLLLAILALLEAPAPATEYRVGSPCELDQDGNVLPPFRVPIPPESGLEALLVRLDAIAELIEEHKNQRQPVCRSRVDLDGMEVTVRFIGVSPTTGQKVFKKLTYRDQGTVNLDAHRAHWAGFGFQSGPWQVILSGPWGQPQVWASSPEEGRRVLRHAASIAGIDEGHPDAEWVQNLASDSRIGRPYPVTTALLDALTPWVTSRPGPSGPV